MTRPRLVLLDEPTAALSPVLVDESFCGIAGLAGEGAAVLLIEQPARQGPRHLRYQLHPRFRQTRPAGPARELLDDERAASLFLGQANAG
jgi:branched-chain amino acid transport system ATP-binding protein